MPEESRGRDLQRRDASQADDDRTVSAHDRSVSADNRDRIAEERDQVSQVHDEASETRDEDAEARDRSAEHREQDAANVDAGAASDRARAQRDRRAGASDRAQAAGDREAASTDRALSARDRAAAAIDGLTGAHLRDAGIAELAREVARARRTRTSFVLAFVDVDGLKATNDSLGHAAGDQLLSQVVDTMRSHIRPYDLIVRFGGDEFVCALLDSTLVTAGARFSRIAAELAASAHASISIGLAELTAQDSLDDLISRADASLRAERRLRGMGRN